MNYNDFPDHPLYKIPQEVLDAARKPLLDAVAWKDVSDEDIAIALADAVVIGLVQIGRIKYEPSD